MSYRITVRVADEGEPGVDEEGLSGSHQIRSVDGHDLTILVDLGSVTEGKKHTAAELVSHLFKQNLSIGLLT